MKRILSRAIGLLRAGWLGLAGQGLTFIAMFAPLVWARFDQLSYLLISAAGAVVLAYSVTLAFSSLFPRLASPGELTTSLRTSLATLVIACGLLAMAAVAASFLRPSWSMALAGWASMTFFQGLYLMSTGLAVRDGRYKAIPIARLIYGAVLASLTIAACVLGGPRYSLVAATCLAYVLGAGYIISAMWDRVHGIFMGREPVMPRRALGIEFDPVAATSMVRPSWRQYLKTSGEAGLSQALNGTASQLSVLILPGLGAYHNAWTAILRLVGGFGTVSMQLVAPALDIELSTAIREGDHHHAQRVLRREFFVGTLVGVVALFLAAIFFIFTPALKGLNSGQIVTIIICVIVYAIAVLSVSVMFNAMILVGGDRPRLVWAAVKSVCIVAVLFFGGNFKLVASVAVETVFAVAYAVMVFRLNARHRAAQGTSEIVLPGGVA